MIGSSSFTSGSQGRRSCISPVEVARDRGQWKSNGANGDVTAAEAIEFLAHGVERVKDRHPHVCLAWEASCGA